MGEDKTLIGRNFPGIDICLKDGRIHVTTPYGVVGAGADTFVGTMATGMKMEIFILMAAEMISVILMEGKFHPSGWKMRCWMCRR